MLTTLAIANYRSLLDLVVPLGPVNLVTGPNGSGKSNLYRALRLLAETARDGVVNALAREGGLQSTFWAGPESISGAMRKGTVPIQGTRRSEPVRLRLGFAGEDFGYAISFGLPAPSRSTFSLDPEIKRECLWAGAFYRPASLLVDRKGAVVRVRDDKEWKVLGEPIGNFDSLFSQVADPEGTPEVFRMRENIRHWRFYDHFRTDHGAPARQPQLGTRTPVLHHDGSDLAAALQTIREIGDAEMLDQAVSDAFPGARVEVMSTPDGRFAVEFHQEGLLRPLSAAELSDGTLRYLLWIAALLTPRPPPLMVLNEPETSLHPDLLPALGRLVIAASKRSQVWVVSHAARLARTLEEHPDCRSIRLEKEIGATRIEGLAPLEAPPWKWPED
jgi:predicted ATPase